MTRKLKANSYMIYFWFLLIIGMNLYILLNMNLHNMFQKKPLKLIAATAMPSKKDPAKMWYSYVKYLTSLFIAEAQSFNKACVHRLQTNETFMRYIQKVMNEPNGNIKSYDLLKKHLMECKTSSEKTVSQVDSTTIRYAEPLRKYRPKYPFKNNYIYEYDTESNEVNQSLDELQAYHLVNCLTSRKKLQEQIPVDFSKPPPNMDEIKMKYPQLAIGGQYKGPFYCKPRSSVAIIIPFRNRTLHLRYWLYYTLGLLIKQQVRFRVYVAEQLGKDSFNKGQIMNTAFKWISENSDFDCFIFHDVDLIAEIPGNFYDCAGGKIVKHLSPFIDKFNYSSLQDITVGGVLAFTTWQYRAVNGYSNEYWGWGGEDDDMAVRLRIAGLGRLRPLRVYGRYKMIPHERDELNPINKRRFRLLRRTRVRMWKDGLNSLQTSIVKVSMLPTHTLLHIKVSNVPKRERIIDKYIKTVVRVPKDISYREKKIKEQLELLNRFHVDSNQSYLNNLSNEIRKNWQELLESKKESPL